jgi:hypothetical protein
MDDKMFDEKELRRLSRELIRKHQLVAAGWLARVASSAPGGATPAEVYASRASFFCGVEWMLDIIEKLQRDGSDKKTVLALIRTIDREIKEYMRTSDLTMPDITTAGGDPPDKLH